MRLRYRTSRSRHSRTVPSATNSNDAQRARGPSCIVSAYEMSCWASGSGLKVWGFGVGSWGLGVWVCGNSGADQEGLTRELLRSAPTPTGCDPPARATQRGPCQKQNKTKSRAHVRIVCIDRSQLCRCSQQQSHRFWPQCRWKQQRRHEKSARAVDDGHGRTETDRRTG